MILTPTCSSPRPMKPTPLLTLVPVSLLTLWPLAGSALAQDTVVLRDGTVIADAAIISWTAKEIEFREARAAKTRPAHEVDVNATKLQKFAVDLDRAGTDTAALVGLAEANTDDSLLASAALYNAALIFIGAGDDRSWVSALEQLEEQYPNSPYAPEYYRFLVRYYLTGLTPRATDAAAVATRYAEAARKNGWSIGYERDAEYWALRASSLTGTPDLPKYVDGLKKLARKSEKTAVFVYKAATVNLGDAYRGMQRLEDAEVEYQRLVVEKGLEADVRAQLYLGLGYLNVEYAKTKSGGDTDHLHEAIRNYLKVYLSAKDADPEFVAEALYNAAKTLEVWNKIPDSIAMAGLLRGRLKRRAPWKDTSWANR